MMKLPKIAMLCALSMMPFFPVKAQTVPATAQSSELWDMWREGFEKYEKAESLSSKKEYSEALRLYQESLNIFLKIKTTAPDWNKDVVFYRLGLCNRRISLMKKQGGKTVEEAKKAPTQKTKEERFVNEIVELKEQLRKTRLELMDAKAEASRNALSEKQIRELMTEKDDLLKQVAAAEVRIENMKAEAAKNDRTEEFNKRLADEKKKLEKSTRQISDLKIEIERLNQRCTLYLKNRVTLESKLKESEDKLLDFKTKAAQADAFLQENQELSKVLEQKKTDFDNISAKLQKSDEKILQLEKTIDELKAGTVSDSAGEDSIEKLRDELAAEKKNSEYLTTLAAKLKDETLELKSSMEKKDEEHKKVVLDYVRSAESLAKAQAEITALKAEMHELSGSAATAKVLADENAKLKKDIDTISEKYEELRKKSNVDSIQAAELLRFQNELAELKKEYSEMEGKNEKTDAMLSQDTDLNKLVASLKEKIKLLEEQNQNVSKQAGVLELEKNDLEKKLQNMVPAGDLQTANSNLQKTMDENREILLKNSAIQADLNETRKALETAVRVANDRQQLLESTQGKYTESARKEIEKLQAAVTELMEGRTQYESAIRSLTAEKNGLTEQNKELKLANAAFLSEVATLKKAAEPNPEVVRKNKEILEKARQYEGLYKESKEKNATLEKEKKNLDGMVESMRSEMVIMQSHVDRLRAELSDWSDEPLRQDEEKIARKDKAIDEMVQEIESLKKESSVLKSELNMSKDEVLKYKSMGRKVAENLRTAHAELAVLRTKLANAGVSLTAKNDRKSQNIAAVSPAKPAEETVKSAEENVKPAEETVKPADPVQEIQKAVAVENVSEEDIQRAKAAYEAGAAAEKEKDLDTAIINYWRAADANPNDWKTYFALASVYLKRDDPQSASKAYEKAITLGMTRDESFEKEIRDAVLKNGEK